MTIKISDFMTTFGNLGGGLSINHFMVTFTAPPKVSLSSTQSLSVLCESAPLPGVQIATMDRTLPYGYGPNYKLPIGAVFTDVELRFFGDAKGMIHNAFTSWLDTVVNFNAASVNDTSTGMTPWFVNYLDDISSDTIIQAFDPIGNAIITYTLIKSYPTWVGDIQGDWGAQDQLVKIPVRFNFVNWKVKYSALTPGEGAQLTQIASTIKALNSGISISTQQSILPLTNANPSTNPAFASMINSYQPFVDSASTTDVPY